MCRSASRPALECVRYPRPADHGLFWPQLRWPRLTIRYRLTAPSLRRDRGYRRWFQLQAGCFLRSKPRSTWAMPAHIPAPRGCWVRSGRRCRACQSAFGKGRGKPLAARCNFTPVPPDLSVNLCRTFGEDPFNPFEERDRRQGRVIGGVARKLRPSKSHSRSTLA